MKRQIMTYFGICKSLLLLLDLSSENQADLKRAAAGICLLPSICTANKNILGSSGLLGVLSTENSKHMIDSGSSRHNQKSKNVLKSKKTNFKSKLNC